jgi:DNA processing protein
LFNNLSSWALSIAIEKVFNLIFASIIMGKIHYNTKFTENELVKWFKLTQVPGLGPAKATKLFSYFKNINAIFEAKTTELLQTRVFNEKMIDDFNKLKAASDENFINVIRECRAKNVEILTLIDKAYPKSLTYVSSPPFTLYLLGQPELLSVEKIAIVGTQEPNEKAARYAYDLSKYLSEKNITIVSGGARGIDTAAHKGALDSDAGKTIAVLGTGFNYPYPPENAGLFEQIKKRGLLISEHLPNFKGSRISYLQRNRITSGISDALFLVAAKEKGGSLTQVSIAHSQRKPIFCPQLGMGLLPEEGVKESVLKYHVEQVRTPEQLLERLNTSLSSFF